jgi:adenosylhomocysteine nucleosidase
VSIQRALVLAPMTLELRPLVKRLGARSSKVEGITVFTAPLGDIEVVVSRSGVGPSAARAATERLLDRLQVDHVVVSGIAGGIDPDSVIGGVVVPDTVVDVSSGRKYQTSPLGALPQSGTVGTVDELINDPVRLAGLVDDGIVALEMESSGVGEVCHARGVPWSVVRVISDRPNDGLTDDAVMAALRPDGSVDVLAAVRVMAVKPSRIPGFMQLGRDASMAARKAAATTLAALR